MKYCRVEPVRVRNVFLFLSVFFIKKKNVIRFDFSYPKSTLTEQTKCEWKTIFFVNVGAVQCNFILAK